MSVNPESTPEQNKAPEKAEANVENQAVPSTEETAGKTETTFKTVEQLEQDPNWRAFREARKKDRAEREEAERKAAEKEAEATALRAAMEAAFAKSSPQMHSQEYEEETEDQKIEKKIKKALAERDEQYRQEAMRREREEYPQRLTQTYRDFNSLVTQENLDYLDYHYPEVSRPLQRLQDGFDKWSDIYHAIKKFVPNHQSARKDIAKADINQAKPKSMSSLPNPAQSGNARESQIEVEKRRAARYEEMKRIMNGLG